MQIHNVSTYKYPPAKLKAKIKSSIKPYCADLLVNINLYESKSTLSGIFEKRQIESGIEN